MSNLDLILMGCIMVILWLWIATSSIRQHREEMLLNGVRRAIDHRAFVIKQFTDNITRDANYERGRYAYNELVELRREMHFDRLMNLNDWDGPEAKDKIWL